MEKIYWKGLEELRNDSEFVIQKNNEFPEELPVQEIFNSKVSQNSTTDRRDFLKFLGFGVAAATLASCEAPVQKTIPYLMKPEEIVLGKSNWYASTFADGYDYCSILVKTREGRPIKIEGNPKSSITSGGTNARVQATVLGLYDSARLKTPVVAGKADTWENADSKIKERLDAVAAKGGKIRIISSSIISPSTKKVISEFSAKYPGAKHVSYDAISYSAMIEANKASFGKSILPSYQFDKAEMIVSFGADFLTSWISPIEFSKQYVANRKLRGKKKISRHIQFETALSLAGSNADVRYPIKPSEQSVAILSLYNHLAAMSGSKTVKDKSVSFLKDIGATAKELWANKGKALVVCNSNDVNTQIVVNAINSMLESYGNTINLDRACYLRQGSDADMMATMAEMAEGSVDAVIFYNCNPAYTAPKPEEFKKALAKVGTKISFADRSDETASLCDFICPDHHYLESWGDAQPYQGQYSLSQPTIAPLFKTRAAQESLLKWSGNNSDYHTYIQENWKNSILNNNGGSFSSNWSDALQSGVYEGSSSVPEATKVVVAKGTKSTEAPKETVIASADLTVCAEAILKNPAAGAFEIVMYEKTGLGNGSQANNPWLQELPDPISKMTWDNYLAVSIKFAKDNNLEQGTMVSLEANGSKLELPIQIQPGQAYGTGSVALGYGRKNCGKAANDVGKNAYSLSSVSRNAIHMMSSSAKIEVIAGPLHEFASTQTHHTMMGRAIVKETTLADFIKDPSAGNAPLLLATPTQGKLPPEKVTLWNEHENPNHHWGMSIDLNSCIGCGSCVIGCQSENNVPVVGKDEVRRSREMHWIRIDRYYTSDMTKAKGKEAGMSTQAFLNEMETPSENPQVVFQPVMCQQCNHAPCETVCPVAATTHSSEGLNQMTYNRCIGTRYCANNCPYKVRRFNWFKYADNELFDFNMNDDLGKMVLNPDVVVRSRGVMEKCSFCVQRIQEGKLEAKMDKRKLVDGEIKTACAQACPTHAIVFGDMNDPNSEVSQLNKDQRSYHLLEELNVQPNVTYMTKVRNTEGIA